MEVHAYRATVRHKDGDTHVISPACTAKEAREHAANVMLCPLRCVVKVKRITPRKKVS